MYPALSLLVTLFAAFGASGVQTASSGVISQDDRPTAEYYFLLGRQLEGEGKIEEAINALKRSIELEPQSAEPRAELAALFARQDRPDDAITTAEAALKINPSNGEANRILGSVLAARAEQQGRTAAQTEQDQSRAIKALEMARAATPDSSLDLTLSHLYLERNRPADAVPLLRRIVDDQPTYENGWLLLSGALERSGHADEAANTLEAALQEQPTLSRVRLELAELQERRRQWAKAADVWADLQLVNPRNAEIAARRGAALLTAGRADAARSVLKDALGIKPGDVRLTYMLAQAERDAGDLDAAETTARALRAEHPEDVRGAYLLAQIFLAKGRQQDAIDLLKPEIARLRESSAPSGQIAMLLDSQGLALQQLRRHDEAIEAFKEAAERAPSEPVRHALLIQGLSAANRTSDALAAADAARRKFPDDNGIVYQLGAALDRAGRREEAERTFRELLARDPHDANALNYLGYMFAEQGVQLDEAVKLIERALAVEPGNPSFLDSLGWAYVQQGRLDLADQPLTAAAEKLPRNSVVQDHLGDLRLKQNRRSDAIAAWERALDGDGESVDRAKIKKKIQDARKSR